jgi:ATP/maltotriose-dependent transcriptional regulator MalT
MSLLAGETESAVRLAARVIDLADAERQQPERVNDYWLLATLGEAHLLRGESSVARKYYSEAVAALQRQDEGSVLAGGVSPIL